MRGHESTVEVLLDAGIPPAPHNKNRWTPMHEAMQAGHENIAKKLAAAYQAHIKAKMKAYRAQLLHKLTAIPDVTFQLK